LSSDSAVRGLILTGRGKAFCGGGDLKWAVGFSDPAGGAFHALAGQFHRAIVEIRRMRKPVLAAINGVAAGGGFSLALACDFRIMEKSAVLKQAYTSNGLCIDGGGTFTLPRLVGLARALEIAAFDPAIASQQALEWGLVTRVADDGAARQAAESMLALLLEKSCHAFGWAKKLLTDAFDTAFETQLEAERNALVQCADHPEGREGLAAFLEKRKPKWRR
jgi:2-(1,2-epoxy-1,2-dihydrophenyl)acetyl-CoA isomerase